jgi:carbon-monoxide dehydrogenase iron sulfur subunit
MNNRRYVVKSITHLPKKVESSPNLEDKKKKLDSFHVPIGEGMEKVKVIVFHPEKCKGHMVCEKACSQVMHKNENGGQWAALNIIKTEKGFSMTNCNQCGLCIDLCPVQAIRRLPSGIVVVNKNTCIGCLSCVAFCPRHVMRRAPELVVPHKCISCGSCVRACPEGALELVEIDIVDVEETVYHKQGVCQ